MKIIDDILVPCDWQQVNVWKEKDPNMLGEALRQWCFKGRNGQRGCYETFELANFFEEIKEGEYFDKAGLSLYNPNEKFLCFICEQKEIKDESYNIEPMVLVVAWQWGGDGCLYFRLKDKGNDIEVVNSDCKNDYEWEFVK